jgi:hypothetical protein
MSRLATIDKNGEPTMINVEDTVLMMEETIESEVKKIFGSASFTKDDTTSRLKECVARIKGLAKDGSGLLITIPMIDFAILSTVSAKRSVIDTINEKAPRKLMTFFQGDGDTVTNVLSIIEESLKVDDDHRHD